MLAFTVPAIAFVVYIAQFKEDFEKKDLDLLIPVCVLVIVVGVLLKLLASAL